MEIAALVFVLVMIAVAYIAFRILRRTFKMAFRAIIVLIILGIAVIGGLALWNMDLLSNNKATANSKTR